MLRSLLTVALILAMGSFAASADVQKPLGDELAIRKALESYVDAFNRGDATAAASHWSRNGEYLPPASGERLKGPDKIRSGLEAFFAQNKDLKVKAASFDIRLQSANRAVEKGIAVFERPGEPGEDVLYTASLVKEDGAWKLLKVEEEASPVPLATIAQLGQLEWLIGDWVDQDESGIVETTFRWTKDYAFISGTFRVTVGDSVDLEGTQVIGWDPAAKKIRSWIFDSKAGYGEGEWSRAGNTWTVKVKSTLGTGEKASSMNLYTYVDPTSFTWQSVSREVDGEPLPDIDAVKVVRKNAQKARTESGK
jgi:uncharacterized protein (TIGR02246 family)